MKRDLKNLSHHMHACTCQKDYKERGVVYSDCIWCTDSKEIVIAQKETSTGFADWLASLGFTKNKETGMWSRNRHMYDITYTIERLYDIYLLPFNTRGKILIEDVGDFNSVASDMVTDFMISLGDDERFTRTPTEDDLEDFGGHDISWIYNRRAMDLCDRYVKRLSAVGAKYFDENDIEIETGIIEP